ncbi:hypothetical protein FNW25_10520 [Flavobacterium franklandianum]|uniref:Lipoprotein n=1 Tax=Flavobacterium franklandianum TaxID=2594430 RepID=A0A553CQR0_9FLAO|nr:hypothetical protein [Flavobacterium franklandianum]TRX22880.1 hypothetical protein FNW17_03700 [Flavobacterium franklandianum]TRX24973.1 hypothetical protein FNW25_10520 [Flavobacterium franklandianum]
MKKIKLIVFMFLAITVNSCDNMGEDLGDYQTESGSGTGAGTGTTGTGSSGGIYNGSKPTGNYWSRNDGAGIAYLSLSGSTAKACSGGKETIGTFNSSKPSMTFTIGTDVIEFPLLFINGKLIVGVPNQAVTTNNPTQYVASSNYPCVTGGITGGVRPKGQFKIIINKPTGNCSSSNTNLYRSAWAAGTVVTSSFNSDGIQSGSIRVINQGPGPLFINPETSWTYLSLSGQSKLNWEFFPDASQWPSSCSQIGESFIDFEGQIKTIIIW